MGRPRLPIDIEKNLATLFRQRGFDGVSLSVIEGASGMGKASLFHRYPGGKDDMARTTIHTVTEQFESALAESFKQLTIGKTQRQLHRFLSDYYARGELGCLLGAFAVPEIAARFRPELQNMLQRITACICIFLGRSGLNKLQAMRRAEDFLADLQGSLVLTSVSANRRQFDRRLTQALTRLFGSLADSK